MGRKLKGTVVNPQPSWNIKRMYGSAGGTGSLGLGQIGAVGLQNTATAGEWLVIWDVQVFSYPYNPGVNITILDCAIMTGRTGAARGVQPNKPLASAVASGPGQVWIDVPSSEVGGIFFSGSIPQNGYQWVHDWPFCAIQPGDSCVFYSDARPGTDFSVNFLYEVVPGGL